MFRRRHQHIEMQRQISPRSQVTQHRKGDTGHYEQETCCAVMEAMCVYFNCFDASSNGHRIPVFFAAWTMILLHVITDEGRSKCPRGVRCRILT
jgi:hypothetical protein